MPVYNSEKFLKESLQSVLSQSYENLEIIAVDDGSTDNSLEILSQFKGDITIIHQENQGLAGALNTGIKKMTGKWFKWFSPDDILNPDAVKILVEEAKKFPENTVHYSNWEMIDGKGKKLREFHESNYNDVDNFGFNVRLFNGQQVNINTCLIPRLLFDKGCMMRNLDDTVAIDYDFFLRSAVLYNTSFHLIEKNLIKYRIYKGQTSHKNIVKSLEYLDNIREDVLEELDEKTRNMYITLLKNYSNNKKFDKKIMEFGLKIVTKFLPKNISNILIVFYLNKIRSGR